MSKTIIVCGYGPGISKAVAEKFGAQGFSIALVARSAERLAAGVQEFDAKGIKAHAFTCDLGDPAAVKGLIAQVRAKLGGIDVLEWTAYSGSAGDLLTADENALYGAFDVAITGLLTAVQECLPDLKKNQGAVLVTNGGFGFFDPAMDAAAVQYNAMGLAMCNSAKHKLVRMLHLKLKPDGVYVGEAMVAGVIKGSAFDQGYSTMEGSKVAGAFWDMYTARTAVSTVVS